MRENAMDILALYGVALAGFCCLLPEEALYWMGKIRTFLTNVQLRYLHLVREAAYQDERDRQELAHIGHKLSAIRRQLKRLAATPTHTQKRRMLEQKLAVVEQQLNAAQQKRGEAVAPHPSVT